MGENRNYGHSIGEAAERFGLDEKRMTEHVKTHYEEMGLTPICVLCDQRELEEDPCDGFNLGGGDLWHCPYMTISEETINKFKLESKV